GARARRRRLAPDRDRVRHAERQGGDLRGADALRRGRRDAAARTLRHHQRRLRKAPVRADDRGVLELGAPRAAALHRAQLRARRAPAPTLHRGAGRDGGHLRVRLPERGLPNAFGEYDESPAETAEILREYAESGLVNVVGGCCGTTPEHIRLLREGLAGRPPRRLQAAPVKCRLAGLEPLNIDDESLFVNVGERTNVTGSAK